MIFLIHSYRSLASKWMIRIHIFILPVAIDIWFGYVIVTNVGCIPYFVLMPSFCMWFIVVKFEEYFFKYSWPNPFIENQKIEKKKSFLFSLPSSEIINNRGAFAEQTSSIQQINKIKWMKIVNIKHRFIMIDIFSHMI